MTRDMVRKIEDEACGAGELPAIEVEFCSASGVKEMSVAVVPLWALSALLDTPS